jgi:predicted ester cyclase
MRDSVLRAMAVLAFAVPATAKAQWQESASSLAVVQGFLNDVRSGRDPDAVERYFSPQVKAHQVTSEDETTVIRTPHDYAGHIREFLATFGRFSFRVEDILAQGDRVFVRWRQDGQHVGSVDGERPTGGPITEITSAVYRVRGGRIVEYWIQTDRKGLEIQLQRLASKSGR